MQFRVDNTCALILRVLLVSLINVVLIELLKSWNICPFELALEEHGDVVVGDLVVDLVDLDLLL